MSVQMHLRWFEMSEREQAAWGAAFALMHSRTPADAVMAADQAVLRLRELQLDEAAGLSPEYVAARSGIHLGRSEFDSWYGVQLRLTCGHRVGYADPTPEECSAAYDRYERSRGDFY